MVMKINIPKPTKEDKDTFTSPIPSDPRVTRSLVFGNDAAFVNGDMFFGIYGKDVFVRLPESMAKVLLREKGAGAFEPVAGHPMGGYFTLPRAWKDNPSERRKWVTMSLEWTSTLPPKKKR